MLGEINPLEAAHHVPGWVIWMPMGVGVTGLLLAYLCYIAFPKIPSYIVRFVPFIYTFLYRKWFFDEIYDRILVRPTRALGYMLWKGVDIAVIDRFGPNGFAASARSAALQFSRIQTGLVYHYALVMLLGLVAFVSWTFYRYPELWQWVVSY